MSGDTSDRRGFLRLLANEVGRSVREVAAEAADAAAALGDTEPELDDDELDSYPAELEHLVAEPPRDPEPAQRTPAEREAFGLAADLGLSARLDALDALMVRSLRLEPTDDAPGHSRLGGAAETPDGFSRPAWSGGDLAHVLQLDLAEAAALPGHDDVLPDRGLLWVLFDLETGPRGTRADEALGVRVLHDDEAEPGGVETSGRPIALREELTLPPASSPSVEALGLTESERSAWTAVRARLAVSPPAAHRVLGHPDEGPGDMPLVCELVSRGTDIGERLAADDPRRAAVEPDAERWRLLLQLSLDADTGLARPAAARRLYLWIPDTDLRAGDFSRVRALLR